MCPFADCTSVDLDLELAGSDHTVVGCLAMVPESAHVAQLVADSEGLSAQIFDSVIILAGYVACLTLSLSMEVQEI